MQNGRGASLYAVIASAAKQSISAAVVGLLRLRLAMTIWAPRSVIACNRASTHAACALFPCGRGAMVKETRMPLAATRIGDPALAERLRKAVRGEVLFDPFSRGRYSTDASIYQIEPVGVVVPRDAADVEAARAIAVEAGVTLLPRGGGTSQCGQTVGPSLVLDCSKYMNAVLSVDAETRRAIVQPGLVLDRLNRVLKTNGPFFPLDLPTSTRATLGGMAANNSCGSRSLRYGNMVHNVRAIEALLADGTACRMGEVAGNFGAGDGQPERCRDLAQRMRALWRRERDEIAERIPTL